MLKKILSYGAVEGVAKGLNRGLILILPLILSTEYYGAVGLIIAGEFLIPALSLLGLDRALLRFYHEKEKIVSLSNTVFSSVTIFQLIIFSGYIGCYLYGIESIAGISLFPNLFILLLNTYLLNITQLLLNVLRVKEDDKSYFSYRIIFQVCKFCLVVGLSFYFQTELGYLLGVLISLVIVVLLKIKLFAKEFKLGINKGTLKYLFLFCWPFIFHNFAGNVLGNFDRFILQENISLKEIGAYTFAFSVGSSISFAFQGISVFMEPLIYKSASIKECEEKLSYFTNLALFFGSGLFLILLASASFLVPMYFSEEYEAAIPIIPIIALGHLFSPFYLQGNYRLFYNKKSFSIAKISIISAIVSVGLNLLLIPKYGVYAAAYVTFFSLFLIGFLLMYSSNAWKWTKETTILIIYLASALIIFQFESIPVYFMFGFVLLVLTGYRIYNINRSMKSY